MKDSLWLFGVIVESWCWMIRYDLAPQRFSSCCLMKFTFVTSCGTADGARSVLQLERAFNIAAAFYWKPIRCLQRSCCLASLLAHRGYRATIVIGVINWPPASHAWCKYGTMLLGELESRVAPYRPVPPVSPQPDVQEM
jgi:hypothetical protein